MPKSNKSNIQQFMDAFTSMRLTIIVLIVLAAASILVIIFQNYHPADFYGWEEHYRTHTHPLKYKLYSFFQLFAPYHSWWFISLLTLLCISLLLCSIQRFSIIMRIIRANDDFRQETRLSSQENYHRLKLPAEIALPLTARLLKRRFYRIYERMEPERTLLFAKRNAVSRLGPLFCHVGLLALFLGGLIAGIWGKSVLLWGEPGEFIRAPFASHSVKVDDFTIEYNANGQIKDYISVLKVFDADSNLVMDRSVEVNHPLRYGGVSYYQSSYRVHPRKVKSATVAAATVGRTDVDTITVAFGTASPIPQTGYSIELADFAADFQIAAEGVISKSEQLSNPAFLVQFLKDGENAGHQWVFARFPSVHSSEEAPFRISLVSFDPLYYTGLQAAVNPGTPFIWTGFAVMTLGLILVFYFNHRLVWVAFTRRPGGEDEIHIAGSSHKFKEQFKQETADH
ncbi:MAG: cytochrome c biogenesis protein ResB [Chitinivibrionia bacterium]|nr:cytochrome c biogenesis protein ResB [Chitinivibrionia bacterium]